MRYITILFISVTTLFFNCTAQKSHTKVSNDEYQFVTNFNVDYNDTGNHYMINNEQLNNFYQILKKTYPKSPPRIQIDYSKNKVALLNFKHVSSYDIDSVTKKKSTYYLHLTRTNANFKQDSTNLMMLIIPNHINNVVVKK